MADSRQIIWRASLRSRCKHSTRVQTVLPHNMAWPFLPFLLWCGRHGSGAMICGRKGRMAPALAARLKQRVPPDNVARPIFPLIFLRADTKLCLSHKAYPGSGRKAYNGASTIICQRGALCASGGHMGVGLGCYAEPTQG